MVIRKINWLAELGQYVFSVSRKPFAWGEHDCALFAASAVEAMTGVDPAAKLRGKYKTAKGALRALKRLGFDSHIHMAEATFQEILDDDGKPWPIRAEVGDMAVVPTDGEFALGIVQGERIYVIRPEQDGIGTVPLTDAIRAFKV